MTRRAYLYFVLIFLLGVVVGGAGMFLSRWYLFRQRGFSKQRVVRRLTRELSLSDAQVQQLNQIMDESIKKYTDLHHQADPQFEALRRERQDRIRQILTPEQVAKFNQLVRRFEERSKRRRAP